MVCNFLTRVQRCKLRPSDDEELLLGAQHAHLGHRGEGGAPVEDPPGDGVGGAPVLDRPDVSAQDGLALVSQVFEGFVVVSLSLLPRCAAAASIVLHHPFPIGLDLGHGSLVDNIPLQAVTLEGAGAGLPGGFGTYIYICTDADAADALMRLMR